MSFTFIVFNLCVAICMCVAFTCVVLVLMVLFSRQIGTIQEYPSMEDPNIRPLQTQNKQLSFSVRNLATVTQQLGTSPCHLMTYTCWADG